MFAAAKKGSSLKAIVLKNIRLIVLEKGVKIFSKKRLKSIVGVKKGFYICTRLKRKRFKKRKTKFINILN